jgi:hypothetical protein
MVHGGLPLGGVQVAEQILVGCVGSGSGWSGCRSGSGKGELFHTSIIHRGLAFSAHVVAHSASPGTY